jgi:DUF2934 family protein
MAKNADQTPPRRPSRARSKKTAAPAAAETVATANDSAVAIPEELPNVPEPGDAADRAQQSESMASEPSEDDIRLRAYHRYLARGAVHGRHVDDWIEAERELKKKK